MGSGQHPPPDHATTTTATAADAGGYYFGPAIKCVAFGDERPAPTRDPASPHPTAPAGGPSRPRRRGDRRPGLRVDGVPGDQAGADGRGPRARPARLLDGDVGPEYLSSLVTRSDFWIPSGPFLLPRCPRNPHSYSAGRIFISPNSENSVNAKFAGGLTPRMAAPRSATTAGEGCSYRRGLCARCKDRDGGRLRASGCGYCEGRAGYEFVR